MLRFWHHHVPVFVLVASPLYNLLKKWLVWHWDEVHEKDLRILPDSVEQFQALGPVRSGLPFGLHVDISDHNFSFGLLLPMQHYWLQPTLPKMTQWNLDSLSQFCKALATPALFLRA